MLLFVAAFGTIGTIPDKSAKVKHANDIFVVRAFLVQGLRLIEVILSRLPILIKQPLFVQGAKVVTGSPLARPLGLPPPVRRLTIELKP